MSVEIVEQFEFEDSESSETSVDDELTETIESLLNECKQLTDRSIELERDTISL